MNITPITDLEERIRLFRKLPLDYPHYLFLSHLDGLERFSGRSVLEIGGTDDNNMADFFLHLGAEYETVRLEKNEKRLPYVNTVRDYLYLPAEKSYDLVLSLGVFEHSSISRDREGNDYRSIYDSHEKYLRKLLLLTAIGAYNIIATISDPCMFSSDELQQVGFEVNYRTTPFSSLGEEGYQGWDRKSELVLLKRIR